MPVTRYVFDSSAILAWLRLEPGGEKVTEASDDSVICAVNLAEVATRLVELGYPFEAARKRLEAWIVEPADAGLAFNAAALRPLTRHRGLSLGDRFCLALAQRTNLPVLTADRAWADLDLGVKVVLIR